MTDQRQREGSEEGGEHNEKAGIARRRQGEINDARRADQFDRPRQQLSRRDRRPGVEQLETEYFDRPEMQQRADGVEPGQGEQHNRDGAPAEMRHVDDPQDEIRLDHQHEARQQQIAERERYRAEGDEQPDLGSGETLGRIGAIAHDRPGKHRGADIMRKRVSGEGHEADEAPG